MSLLSKMSQHKVQLDLIQKAGNNIEGIGTPPTYIPFICAPVFYENKTSGVTATVSTPETHNTPFGQDVTKVLHLVITMLEDKILLTCRNSWHLCSRYG